MKVNELPFIMIKCLVCTIIIEIVIAKILKVKTKKDFLNIFLVNIMTNPVVVSFPVYVNIKYGLLQRNIVLYILEIIVVFLEGFVYKNVINYNKINPYILSFILNMGSYFIGNIINQI